MPLAEERPKALLELLGRARGPLRGHVLLSADDASAVCKTIVALLLVDKTTENDLQAENEGISGDDEAGETAKSGENGDQNEAIPKTFALEVDQEVYSR